MNKRLPRSNATTAEDILKAATRLRDGPDETAERITNKKTAATIIKQARHLQKISKPETRNIDTGRHCKKIIRETIELQRSTLEIAEPSIVTQLNVLSEKVVKLATKRLQGDQATTRKVAKK